MTLFDRAQFLRPIAHRGLHDDTEGRVENTAAAFEAAIRNGYGIECDLRPARGGLPIVFHDETVDRLTLATGRVADLNLSDVQRLRTRTNGERILTFAELLKLVGGRVPLLVEVKSEWDPPDVPFLSEIARAALDYTGPIALMSFDPDVMTVLRELATEIPRGLVSGSYRDEHGETWWPDRIDAARAAQLANLEDWQTVAPSFIAYHVRALPSQATTHLREDAKLPIFTWTVRTEEDWAIANTHADAAIFEGVVP
jgi:glycerophosphoryl diester phosphodiesterase